MKIENSKIYRMRKYFFSKDETQDYGYLDGESVKRILKGYTYDETFGMWFSDKANVGYEVTETH